MPELPNRDEVEAALARKLGRIGAVWVGKILEALGDPPDINNLPSDFWDDMGVELMDAIRPTLGAVYLAAAQQVMEDTTIGVDWTLVNESAAQWARQYTFDLVTGINDTTRRKLRDAISAFYQEQMTIGELCTDLTGLFGPVRADMIATTEVTRASVQGERATVAEIEKMGTVMEAVWQTRNDEMVCEICGPRNGQVITDGIYPPAHIRCRCFVNHRFVRVYAD